MKSDLVDVDVIYQTETEKAVCVREHETATKDIWIPKSQCQFYRKAAGNDASQLPARRGCIISLTAPASVLEDKGLV